MVGKDIDIIFQVTCFVVNVSFPQVYHTVYHMPDAFVKHFGRGMIFCYDSETDVPHQNTGLRSTYKLLPDS